MMRRDFWYRFTFLILVIATCVYICIPTFFNLKEDSFYPYKKQINLGLDLQGGLYMVLGIDFKKVYKDEIATYMRKVEYSLNDIGIASEIGDIDLKDIEDPKQSITIKMPGDFKKAKDKIKEFYSYPLRITKESGTTLQLALNKVVKDEIEKNAVGKSIEVIRNRIDEFGVTEPEIISQGNNRIVVQLPGIKDIDRAKALIGRTAKLEFRLVNDEFPAQKLAELVAKSEKNGIVYQKGENYSSYISRLNEYLAKDLPKGYIVLFQRNNSKKVSDFERIPYLVEETAQLSGDDLQDARVQVDQQNNNPYVGISFKSSGAKIFADLTEKNVNKRLAVILDDNVYTAPNIQQKISGGNAQITLGAGNYNDLMEQARDIALVLRAGALPVQLDFEEQRIIGPSLGSDSIRSATIASLIGCILGAIAIFWYYRVSGFVTNFVLTLNVLLLMAILISMGATLTLPGIAGIALTFGMAVDANIIIFERIKEEIQKGAAIKAAVDSGFHRAFWTILDANLTTAIAGLCLLNFGTGPIRGFAVTLLIGLIGTMYCCYFVTKICFEIYMKVVDGKKISI